MCGSKLGSYGGVFQATSSIRTRPRPGCPISTTNGRDRCIVSTILHQCIVSFILHQCIARARRKEGHVLFNDTLNTFYLRLYGVKHMVKDHSDSERENPLPPHGLLFRISSKGSFICIIPQTDNTYYSHC